MQRLGSLLSNVKSIAELLAYQGRQDLPPFASMLPHHYCKLLNVKYTGIFSSLVNIDTYL